jgi:hypothetical protein
VPEFKFRTSCIITHQTRRSNSIDRFIPNMYRPLIILHSISRSMLARACKEIKNTLLCKLPSFGKERRMISFHQLPGTSLEPAGVQVSVSLTAAISGSNGSSWLGLFSLSCMIDNTGHSLIKTRDLSQRHTTRN